MPGNALFEQITDRLVTAIEAGAGEFRMPWHRWGTSVGMPVNACSGHVYRGFNVLALWAEGEAKGFATGRWATYRQWQQAGAQVRRGERGTAVLFWQARGARADVHDEEPALPVIERRLLSRVFTVFNQDQVEGSPPAAGKVLGENERVGAAENLAASSGVQVRHGGDSACYVPAVDEIRMPHFGQFRDAQAYYATLLHELVHSTGARNRLDRDLSGRFGSSAYAAEELVAELGSAFLCGHLGLSKEPRADHAAYLQGWLGILRSDTRAIVSAAAHAQRAADYLIARKPNSAPAPVRPDTSNARKWLAKK
jgi:antirestriction protein ArdC